MKSSILIQLDPDPQPSVFDAVVAIDAGAEHLLRHSGVTPESVEGLVHGAIFTRGQADLSRTAIFIGGSDVAAGESLFQAVRKAFFGPFRVSVLLDPNGCNTTAAAAVLAIVDGAGATIGDLKGAKVAVLGGTGPVGRRVARLLLNLGAQVAIGSRRLDRAEAAAASFRDAGHEAVTAFATDSDDALRAGLEETPIVVAAGAAGIVLLPSKIRKSLPGLTVAVDLNAVPPVGIEGIEPTDKKADRDGVLSWGALGVGDTKMKIHRKAIASLFEANDRILDAEECLAIGQSLG